MIMSKIEINNCVYKTYPIYDQYAVDKNGNVVHIVKQRLMKGNKNHIGYLQCSMRQRGQKNQKVYYVHRFIWECYNGLIPDGKVIDHINDDKIDNRLCNLQLFTPQQNSKKSAKNKDYSYLVNKIRQNLKCVKATNCNTGEETYFNSMSAVQQHLDMNAGNVKMICDRDKYRKTGTSKKDGCKYKFEYINEEDLPDNYKKSANIRPRLSDYDKKLHKKEANKKWRNKDYKCPNCGNMMKNGSKYNRNKTHK